MNKLYLLFVLCIVIGVGLMPGCGKDPEPKFVPGNVIVGFEKEVTLRQAYEFAIQNVDSIGYVHGFYYFSNLPNDSLNYVVNTLSMAELLANADVRIGFMTNRIEVLLDYNIDQDKSTISEWLELTEAPELKFENMQTYKSMLLYIPIGKEKQWLKAHADNPLIRYANLDYYKP